jgi:hypothetical protein
MVNETLFQGYDNPRRAERIWNEYSGDISGLGLDDAAMTIISETEISDDLDARLDQLIERYNKGRSPPRADSPSDEQMGFWSYGIRNSENNPTF